MIRTSRLLRALARGAIPAAAGIALALAAPSRADTPIGPELREGVCLGEIRNGLQGVDVDEFQGRFRKGEALSVKVSGVNDSYLVPALEIVGPDGGVRPVTMHQLRFGRGLEVKRLQVDQTGVWRVRVSARLDTFGGYALRCHLKPGPRAVVDVPANLTGAPAETLLQFDALQGSQLVLDVRGKGGAARVVSLTDPGGAEVAADGAPVVDGAHARKSRVALRVDALASGDGLYTARLSSDPGTGGSRATARVVRPKLPRGTKRYGEKEPFLATRSGVLRGVPDLPVRLYGANFAASGVTVWFGDKPVTDSVEVGDSGSRIDVVPPPGVPGSLVRVGIVNPDGQSYERADYFTYVPPLVLDDLTDRDGKPVRGSSLSGGRLVRMHGANFQSGVTVHFGGVEVQPQIRADGEMDCAVPPHAAGLVAVTIEDAYLHGAALPFEFEYKTPPSVGANPYAPAAAPQSGGVDITMTGSGFEPEDEVLIEGFPQPTTWVGGGAQLRFKTPAGPAGTLHVSVRDRVGTVVVCPDLSRQ